MSELIAGALVAETLKGLIAEAKKYNDFKPLSEDLVSTMERLIPLTEEIDSLQNNLHLDVGELKGLKETLKRAETVVHRCRDVSRFKRFKRTREIEQVNKDLLKFCQIDLQFLLYRNQLQSEEAIKNNFQVVMKKLDDLIMNVAAPPDYRMDLCSVPKLYNEVPVGFDWPLMKLKKKLLGVVSVGRSLLVSAPPGCGKTTLVKQLCHDVEIKTKFKHIFFSVVSRTPDLRVIVQHLLLHNGKQALAFENDSQAAFALVKLLEELIKDGPILLVLDDVWKGADLLQLLLPIDIRNLKILVTSRFDLPDFGYTYHLKPLEDKYAKTLLVECASRPDHASPPEYEELLQKILKRCNGLPIVIKVVGASLKGRSLITWQGKVISWSKRGTLLDNLLLSLQPSFDALDSNLKQCFLDMGSFLEDQKTRSSVIIDMWVELYGDTSMTDKDKSIECMTYLEDLAVHNLLDLVPLGRKEHEDGFYIEFLVTQHDILRDLAIYLSKSEENLERKRKRLNLEIRRDKFPDWCFDPMQPIVNARLLSISTDESFSSTWVEMDCPNVEALVLNLSSSDYALPSFIAGMKKLKVLTVTNHGVFPTRLSNFSCLSSLPNLKRIRLEKASITLLDLPQLRLGSLEKLSLVMCTFGEVFYDSSIDIDDISKALPSLQEIDIDYCYDLYELPYWVTEEAVSLKTLSITNCNKFTKLPQAIGKLRNLEMLRLSSCNNLFELPETIERLSNLRFLDVSGCFQLKKLPLEIGKLQKLKKISMRDCYRCELPDKVKNLENLEVKCDEGTVFLWERFKTKMKNLTITEEETEHNLNLLQL